MSQIIEAAKCQEKECRAVTVIAGIHGSIADIGFGSCSGPKCAHWEPQEPVWRRPYGRLSSTPSEGSTPLPESGRCGLSSK